MKTKNKFDLSAAANTFEKYKCDIADLNKSMDHLSKSEIYQCLVIMTMLSMQTKGYEQAIKELSVFGKDITNTVINEIENIDLDI